MGKIIMIIKVEAGGGRGGWGGGGGGGRERKKDPCILRVAMGDRAVKGRNLKADSIKGDKLPLSCLASDDLSTAGALL